MKSFSKLQSLVSQQRTARGLQTTLDRLLSLTLSGLLLLGGFISNLSAAELQARPLANGNKFESEVIRSRITMVWPLTILTVISTGQGSSVEQRMGRDASLVVEGVTGSGDSIQYKIRRGGDIRNLVLHQFQCGRSIVVRGKNQEILAIALGINDVTNGGAFDLFLVEFRSRGNLKVDTLTRQVMDEKFIATLPSPQPAARFEWKRDLAFLNVSKHVAVKEPLILVPPRPVPGQPGLMARRISDFLCDGGCVNSVCAACMKATCRLLRCIEDAIESGSEPHCKSQLDEVQLVCGGYVERRLKKSR
jgi:hypothetical protein